MPEFLHFNFLWEDNALKKHKNKICLLTYTAFLVLFSLQTLPGNSNKINNQHIIFILS